MTPPTPQGSTRRLGATMIIGAWVLILGLLTAGFGGWLDRVFNPNQVVEGVVLGDGAREVVLRQNRQGHYVATGHINGEPVTFLLDTGATDVSVPIRLATRLGLRRGMSLPVRTANGVVTVYDTTLDQVELGGIALGSIGATINPHVDGEEVLLGMSFLRHLELTQRAGELTLRQRPGSS